MRDTAIVGHPQFRYRVPSRRVCSAYCRGAIHQGMLLSNTAANLRIPCRSFRLVYHGVEVGCGSDSPKAGRITGISCCWVTFAGRDPRVRAGVRG